MITSKRWLFILTTAILLLSFCLARAQAINDKTYQHKMRLMDSLSFYSVKDYDTLYKISVVNNHEYQENYYGWINKRNYKDIQLIRTDGKQIEIGNKQISKISRLPINDTTVDIFIRNREERFRIREFGENYLLSLWLYKKGKHNYSKKLLGDNDRLFSDSSLKDNFGIIYYDAMLSAFSNQRNYPKAIAFGNHLAKNIFKGYQYQKEAIVLTGQLKNSTEDFKAFHIPDTLAWDTLKLKLNRKGQILYLADRLRLLNCIQPGQPAGIGYEMYQFSISKDEAGGLGISYWNSNAKYGVINPFSELLQMKLTPQEMELVLPYLLTDSYIASYSYFRDFRPERTLHKVSWVINELIFQITSKAFLKTRHFDSLSYNQKKAEVEKIKKWCDDNASLSKEDITIGVLKTTNDWFEFRKAVNTAKIGNYSQLLLVIVERYNDFKNLYWPVHKDLIAKTMYELGNEKYIETVRKWSRDTTGRKDTLDLQVNLWTSLFLLKYDKTSYEYAMNKLEFVLKHCDGTAYYPHAMDLLLSMNDKSAFKLAEGIMDKERFQELIDWDYYLNFVKKLLLLKSDYAFNAIEKRLGSFTPEEIKSFTQNNGNVHTLVPSDFYVLAVDQLKSTKPRYNAGSDFNTRLEYKKALSKWFTVQYDLLKNGKPNELLLDLAQVDAPVTFVDSPN